MNNSEKFKEIFGYDIDETASDPCDMVDPNVCINADNCDVCDLFHFWKKEWVNPSESKEAIK